MSIRVNNLSKKNAEIRSKSNYSNILYDLYLDLKNNEENNYTGILILNFSVEDLSNVFINYSGEKISKLIINGNTCDEEYLKINWVDDNLFFKEKYLNKENNKIVIYFSNYYSKIGQGLCLTMGSDKLKYKYTQSEPYFMNRVFPCFDQPDLKGIINFNINSDKDDVVLCIETLKSKFLNKEELKNYEAKNELDNLIINYDNEIEVLWKFDTSFKLSSYLYGMCCGPLIKYEMEENELYKGIPTNIYCRKYKKSDMDKQYHIILYHMRESIRFYNELFLVEYPFKQNNFIFLPEFQSGAMEYPGCVTMNEVYVFDENISKDMIIRRNKTIYHELAHMWFGNLVTMKWWDDLWLNESFANLIAFNAMERVNDPYNKLIDPWIIFDRISGVNEDEKKSTHPIYLDVINTKMADSIFDSITYNKGCGCLIQLVNNIGWENFKINIRNYMKKYKWKNTTLDDFLTEMKNGINNFDVDEFKDDFLMKESLNYLDYKRTEDGIIINQNFVLPEFNYLRKHKLKIIIYDNDMNELINNYFIINKEKITTIKFSKEIMSKAEGILINADGIAWCKFKQDEKTNELIFNNLEKFLKNQLNAKTFFECMFEQVRDGIIKSEIFLKYLFKNIDILVKDVSIMRFLTVFINQSINIFSNKDTKIKYSNKFFNKIYKLFINLKNENNIKNKLFIILSNTCKTDSNKMLLFSLFKLLNLDYTFQLNEIFNIYFKTITINNLKNNIEVELKKLFLLNEDICSKNLIKYKAFKADKEERKNLLKLYISFNCKELNFKEKIYSMEGFMLNNKYNNDYLEDYFNNILNVFRNNSFHDGKTFLINLKPNNDSEIELYIKKYEEIIKECTDNEVSTKNCIISLIGFYRKKLNAISQ